MAQARRRVDSGLAQLLQRAATMSTRADAKTQTIRGARQWSLSAWTNYKANNLHDLCSRYRLGTASIIAAAVAF